MAIQLEDGKSYTLKNGNGLVVKSMDKEFAYCDVLFPDGARRIYKHAIRSF